MCVYACVYLGLQAAQQSEDGEEAAKSVGHVLLDHLPADAQADEGHETEGLQAQGGAGLYPTGEPGHGTGDKQTQTQTHTAGMRWTILKRSPFSPRAARTFTW